LELLGGEAPWRRKGFKDVLLRTVLIPQDSEQLDLGMDDEGKAKKNARDMNKLPMRSWFCPLHVYKFWQGCFQLVKACKMTVNINGDVAQA